MIELYRYLWNKTQTLALAPHESIAVMYVDRHYLEIATVLLGRGSRSECKLHPREVFRIAVQLNAFALLIAHTHPSGNSMPSEADRHATRILQNAGRHLRIPLIGHIVVTKDSWELIECETVENSVKGW